MFRKHLVKAIGLLLALWAGPASAAVAINSCSADTLSSAGVISSSHTYTVPGALTNPAIVVTVATTGGGPTSAFSATWDSGGTNQSMFQIGTKQSGANNNQIYFFGLRGPTSGAGLTLALAWTGSAQVVYSLCVATGVDQTSNATAFKNFNSADNLAASPSSVGITSGANDLVFGAFDGVGTTYSSVSGTQIFNNGSGTTWAAAANWDVGTGSAVTMSGSFSGTFSFLISAGFDLGASSGGGGCAVHRLGLLGAGC